MLLTVISERDILESICKIIKYRARPTFNADDIVEMLARSGKIGIQNLPEEKRLISRKISDLVRRNIIKKVEGKGLYKITKNFWDLARKENVECYKDILEYIREYISVNKDKAIKTLSEIQDEILGSEKSSFTLPEYIGRLIMQDQKIDKIIKDVTDDIIRNNPDPKELFIEMLEDYAKSYEELTKSISATKAGKERDRLISCAGELLRIIEHIFGSVLSIPISRQTECRECPIILPKDAGKGQIRVNKEILKELLKERIIDDKFFVEEEITTPSAAFAGIDTSVAEIDLRRRPFSDIRHLPPVQIFTAVLAIRKGRNGDANIEIYPKPEKITEEDLKKLEEDRDVLPAYVLYRYDDYYIPRIKEAIMQSKEYRLITSVTDGRPSVLIVYKDGAIWPTERKFDDFLYYHKEFVIDNLSEYYKMVRNLSDTVPVVGVVKRGHLGFLWYLINWYDIRKRNKVDIRDLSIRDLCRFISPPEKLVLKDGYLALVMLSRYADARKLKDKGVRLFAIKRKFYATDKKFTNALLKYAEKENKKITELEKDENAWKEIVWSLLIHDDDASKGSELKRFLKGDLDALRTEEYWQDLADLLKSDRSMDIRDQLDYVSIYRILISKGREDIAISLLGTDSQNVYRRLPYILSYADVVFFYYLPPYESLIKLVGESGKKTVLTLPRFEIQINEHVRDVKRLISKISVMPFRDFYVYYGPEEHVDRALIVPVPVKDAHLYAKGEASKISGAFLNLLMEAVIKYLTESGVDEVEA